MHRRDLLSSVAAASAASAAGLAGCTGFGGGCAGGTDVRFEPADADAIADESATTDFERTPRMRRDLAERTLAGEEPTIEVTRGSPLEWLEYVRWGGAYYEVTAETVEKGRVSGPEYELARDPESDADPSSDDALSFSDLPRHDRWRVGEAADYAVDRLGGMGFSTTFVAGYLDGADRERSVLAAGVDRPYLEVDGSHATLERVGEGKTTARRVRHAAETVAEDAETFADLILEERGVEFPEASEDVRALLADAREEDGSLSVCDHERDDEDEGAERRREAVSELETILDDLEAESGTPDRVEYVRYEGEWHRIRLSRWVV